MPLVWTAPKLSSSLTMAATACLSRSVLPEIEFRSCRGNFEQVRWLRMEETATYEHDGVKTRKDQIGAAAGSCDEGENQRARVKTLAQEKLGTGIRHGIASPASAKAGSAPMYAIGRASFWHRTDEPGRSRRVSTSVTASRPAST